MADYFANRYWAPKYWAVRYFQGGSVDGVVSAVGNASGAGAAVAAAGSILIGDGTGSADAISQRLLSLFPDGVITQGDWTTDLGGTDLWTAIDEGVPNDADYIRSANDPSSNACEVSFSDPSGNVGGEIVVEYRYGKSGSGQMDIVVSLKQGPATIASWTHLDVSESEVTVLHRLTGPAISGVTDYNALSLEFSANTP